MAPPSILLSTLPYSSKTWVKVFSYDDGKFGADPLMETHSVIDSNKSDEYNRKYIVTDEIDLKNGKELISFFKDSGQFDNEWLKIIKKLN